MATPKNQPEPTPITYENIEEFERPKEYPTHDSMGNATAAKRFLDVHRAEQETIDEMDPPARNNPNVGASVEEIESRAEQGIRVARSVLRERDASRNAKKVARMLISILDIPVPQTVSRNTRARTKQ